MEKNKEMTVAKILDGDVCDKYDTFMFIYPEYPVNAQIYSSCYRNLSDWDILCIAKMVALEAIGKGYGNLLASFIKQEICIQETDSLNRKQINGGRNSGGRGCICFAEKLLNRKADNEGLQPDSDSQK